jgi:transcriptional regulator with XRE-family HTH domain
MDKKNSSSPYRPLGKKLKALRDRASETLAEASGAVEIDVRQLASYELGHSRPTEDVLLLLISHFGAKDDEAVRLWELAGYGVSRVSAAQMANEEQSINIAENQDTRVLFTDVVDVVVNNYGVVMKFMQGTSPGSQPAVVAKVGMSREHAKSVLHILQATLSQTERTVPLAKKQSPSGDTRKG